MKCCLKGFAKKPLSTQQKIVLGVYRQGPFIRGGWRGFYLSKPIKHHLILELLAAIILTFKIKCRTKGLNKLIFLDFPPPPPNNRPYLGDLCQKYLRLLITATTFFKGRLITQSHLIVRVVRGGGVIVVEHPVYFCTCRFVVHHEKQNFLQGVKRRLKTICFTVKFKNGKYSINKPILYHILL